MVDTELPISRGSVVEWFSFSDEGQLLVFDDNGVLRSFNF